MERLLGFSCWCLNRSIPILSFLFIPGLLTANPFFSVAVDGQEGNGQTMGPSLKPSIYSSLSGYGYLLLFSYLNEFNYYYYLLLFVFILYLGFSLFLFTINHYYIAFLFLIQS